MIWRNKKFLICGFDQEESNIIRVDYIEKYSGELITVSGNDEIKDNEVNYVVCNYSDGYIHRVPNLNYNKLRTPFWLWLSVKDQWNYSLDWHPFFRPNSKFTYNLFSGIRIYILGFTPTIKGFTEECPVFIRDIYDMGILSSFIETQMGGTVENIGVKSGKDFQLSTDDMYSKDNSERIVLVCNKDYNPCDSNNDSDDGSCYIHKRNHVNLNTKDNSLNIMNEIRVRKEKGYQILTINWLFDCYEEGRLLNYRNYIFKYEEEININNSHNGDNIVDNKKNNVKNELRVVVTHLTYLNYKDIMRNIVLECEDEEELNIVIERPSKIIIRYIQEGINLDEMCSEHNAITIIVFNDTTEEQEFWYDLLNGLTESVEFNVNLISNEKKAIVKNFIQKIRIINNPNDFFSYFDSKRKNINKESNNSLSSFGYGVGFSIPRFIDDLLRLKTEILDTVLDMTDLDSITGLSGFVEYADDDTLDIVKYNKNKAVKKFNNIEEEFKSINNEIV
ncbi:hypothetical protein FG379_003094 [Cryptosporidium bovis]|uniref:uncharacterized protein n=1 Tax=Cryptosporidium bovis TaxID=310047 RepID=UPI003519F9E1|nr:hypothetical protein FG379_003094 [Cryptosporidium bovis]